MLAHIVLNSVDCIRTIVRVAARLREDVLYKFLHVLFQLRQRAAFDQPFEHGQILTGGQMLRGVWLEQQADAELMDVQAYAAHRVDRKLVFSHEGEQPQQDIVGGAGILVFDCAFEQPQVVEHALQRLRRDLGYLRDLKIID